MDNITCMKKFLLVLLIISSTSQVDAQLRLNEIYATPIAGQAEWLELYNPTAQPVSLLDWQLAENISGVIKNHELIDKSGQATVSAYGYWLVEPSKVSLNNGGDTIYLIGPSGDIADTITYPKLTSSQVYARLSDGVGEWEIGLPSPLASNQASVSAELSVADEFAKHHSQSTTSMSATPTPTLSTSGKSSTGNTNQSPSPSTSVLSTPTPTATPQVSASPSPLPDWRDDVTFPVPQVAYQVVATPLPVATSAAVLAAYTQTPSPHLLFPILLTTVIIISTITLVLVFISDYLSDYDTPASRSPPVF